MGLFEKAIKNGTPSKEDPTDMIRGSARKVSSWSEGMRKCNAEAAPGCLLIISSTDTV